MERLEKTCKAQNQKIQVSVDLYRTSKLFRPVYQKKLPDSRIRSVLYADKTRSLNDKGQPLDVKVIVKAATMTVKRTVWSGFIEM